MRKTGDIRIGSKEVKLCLLLIWLQIRCGTAWRVTILCLRKHEGVIDFMQFSYIFERSNKRISSKPMKVIAHRVREGNRVKAMLALGKYFPRLINQNEIMKEKEPDMFLFWLYLFLCLCWLFTAVCAFSSCGERGLLQPQCVSFSWSRLLLLQSVGSRFCGLPSLWHAPSAVVAPGLRSTGSTVVAHRLCLWNLPRPGIKPTSSALAGGFLASETPGKSWTWCLEERVL